MSDNLNDVQTLSGEQDSPETKQPKKKKKKEKKKHHLLRRIICLFLGFFLGIFFTVGAIVGGAYYVASHTLEETTNKVDDIAGTDLYVTLFGSTDADGNVITAGLLNASYADATIMQFVSDISDAVGGLTDGDASLADLNEISPKVEETVNKLVDTLAGYGFQMDTQELMSTPFKGENGLVTYVKDSMLDASAGDLFTSFSGEALSPLLATICYGEEGIDYVKDEEGNVTMLGSTTKTTVRDLVSEDLSSVFNKIAVDSVVEISPDNELMCSLAYGSSNRYQFNGDKVTMLQVAYTVDTTGGSVVIYDDSDEKVDGSVETLSDGLYKLTTQDGVSYVKDGKAYADEACATPILYKKVKIGELQGDAMDIIDGILLKDALDLNVKSSPLLLTLSGYEVKNNQLVEKGEPRTIGDLRREGENVFNDIYLCDVMSLEDNYESKITMRFLYGKSGVHYDFKMVDGKPVVTMKEQTFYISRSNSNLIYDENGDLLPDASVNTETKIYTAPDGTQYPYLNKGAETVNGVKVYTCQLAGENGYPLYYKPTTIGDLKGDKNVISNLVNTLTIGEVFDDDVFDSHIFLKHVKNETIETLPDAIERLTVVEVYDEEVHNPDGTLKGSWKYLLTDKDTGEVDIHITVVDMQKMIDNMQYNIHHAVLYDLKADGVLENLDANMLNKEIKRSITTPGGTIQLAPNLPAEKVYLGDLTVDEMLAYVSNIIMYL